MEKVKEESPACRTVLPFSKHNPLGPPLAPLTPPSGFACHVALTGETVRIANVYEDPRFDTSVDELTGYRTRSILCMPVPGTSPAEL